MTTFFSVSFSVFFFEILLARFLTFFLFFCEPTKIQIQNLIGADFPIYICCKKYFVTESEKWKITPKSLVKRPSAHWTTVLNDFYSLLQSSKSSRKFIWYALLVCFRLFWLSQLPLNKTLLVLIWLYTVNPLATESESKSESES